MEEEKREPKKPDMSKSGDSKDFGKEKENIEKDIEK